METDEAKKSAWDGYKWRETLAYVGYVVFAVIALLAIFAPSLGKQIPLGFLLGFALILPIGMWRCPACRRSFHHASWFVRFRGPWHGSCVNCGLRKWQEPPPSSEELLRKRVALIKSSKVPDLRVRRKPKG